MTSLETLVTWLFASIALVAFATKCRIFVAAEAADIATAGIISLVNELQKIQFVYSSFFNKE